ncbi:MAG: hypothetical protein ACYSWX_10390 [Planctomycetota bacterium]|jgi:hypothetical protein
MITLASLATGLALLSFGWSVLALVERLCGTRERGRIERLALALLLGLGLGTALWTGLVIVLGPPSTTTTRLVLGAAALCGLPALARLRLTDRPRPEPWRPSQWLLLVGTGWFLLFSQLYASTLPMHLFDPIYHFSYKGKLVHEEGFGTPSWMVLPDELAEHDSVGRPITHPNYPPGIPALHAIVAGAGDGYDDDATRSLMGLFVLASAGVIWSTLRPRGRTPALFATFVWCSLPLLYYSRLPHKYISWTVEESEFVQSLAFHPLEIGRSILALWIGPTDLTPGARRPDGWTLDGAADLPVAALLLGACVCLWRRLPGSRVESDRADTWIGGALLGAAALAKNEGLALAALTLVAFAGVGLWSSILSRRGSVLETWRELALAALAFAVVIAPWMSIRGAIPSIDEDYPRAIAAILGLGEPPPGAGVTNNTPTNLAGAWSRVPVVLAGFGYSFLHVLRWNLTWIGFVVLVGFWMLRRPTGLARHPMLPLIALVIASVAAYAVILVVTPWDLALLYGTTIPGRLILHVAPLAILCTAGLAWSTRAERGEHGS